MKGPDKIILKLADGAGSNAALLLAFAIVTGWLLAGRFFNFNIQWILSIATICNVTVFLTLLLVQKAKRKESLSIQLKLNELIAASKMAGNNVIDIENKTLEELAAVQDGHVGLGVGNGE